MSDLSVEERRGIERMFSGIVPWYDRLNRLLSLRRDVWWRRTLVGGLALPEMSRILDLAAGTLDVTLELIKRFPRSRIVAVDFSLPMLGRGRAKLAAGGHPLPVSLTAADAYALPFAAEQFAAVTIAFGVRNFPDRTAALAEIRRILQPGGRLAILEFVPPDRGWRQALYRLYLHNVLPLLGRLLSRHAFAYRYLAESIGSFPTVPDFCQELHQAGYCQVESRALTAGIVYLFYSRKSG